jgi:Bacterial protein of unknown function (HtrL_YibB)
MKKITLVTGLWDLGRGDLEEFTRSFDHYLECFSKLTSLDINMVIYVPSTMILQLENTRVQKNTVLKVKELEEFRGWFPFFKQVQSIRTNSDWYRQADWLMKSPQAKLEYYNPVVMSKFFLLNDAATENILNTEYYFWIDAGLSNTVLLEQIEQVKKISMYMDSIKKPFLMLSFPYNNEYEVHGFKSKVFDEFVGKHSDYVCRGGFFGGKRTTINDLNGDYYSFLNQTLSQGVMGTEENILTILSHKHPETIYRYELEDNGLVYKFFDELKDYKVKEHSNADLIPWNKRKELKDIKTYNSPEQFRTMITDMWYADNRFTERSRKILVDNSTDPETYEEYNKLCKAWGFEHIKKENNIGICGGRQFVAEHFNESDSEYYIFFEDDMYLNYGLNYDVEQKCNQGFDLYINGLYEKSLALIHLHRLDFLKLTFTEFFGNNSEQWSWHNVPGPVRQQYFEGVEERPLIENYTRVRYKDLTMRVGPYYYCNWPLWFSRQGNKKVFLDTKWAHPHEQTWMSHVFQLQQKGLIKAGVLELSPITHNRFDHYSPEERVES